MATLVGYLGPEGSFSQQAAQLIARYGTRHSQLLPWQSLIGLLEAVDKGQLHLAVVPVENSIEGSVTVVWDTLALEVDLPILAELVLPINHQLMARAGARIQEIKEVLSHPQALAQCRSFLRRYLPDAQLVAVSSTSEAARLVQSRGPSCAAIGNTLAAKLYDLQVLASDIQDNSLNATRFVLVGKTPVSALCGRGHRTKTSVVFSTKTERAGILYETLWEFASRSINLTRIESRPAKRSLGEYLFYVDMDGSIKDPPVAEALGSVKGRSRFFKILGSYCVIGTQRSETVETGEIDNSCLGEEVPQA